MKAEDVLQGADLLKRYATMSDLLVQATTAQVRISFEVPPTKGDPLGGGYGLNPFIPELQPVVRAALVIAITTQRDTLAKALAALDIDAPVEAKPVDDPGLTPVVTAASSGQMRMPGGQS